MKTNNISTLEELRARKRQLKLEIEATERLFFNTVGLTKARFFQSVKNNFLPYVAKAKLLKGSDQSRGTSLMGSILPDSKSAIWINRLLTLLPMVVGFIVKRRNQS